MRFCAILIEFVFSTIYTAHYTQFHQDCTEKLLFEGVNSNKTPQNVVGGNNSHTPFCVVGSNC